MKKKAVVRLLGAVMLADGLLTLLFGRKFVRLFRVGRGSNPIKQIAEWFSKWPSWLLRGGAAG